MAHPPRTIAITARVLIEPGPESIERTRSYVVAALKNACKNIRDGTVVIGLYDENNQLIGLDVTGFPSSGMQQTIDELLEGAERS